MRDSERRIHWAYLPAAAVFMYSTWERMGALGVVGAILIGLALIGLAKRNQRRP